MGAMLQDIKLNKCWTLLTAEQKGSLLHVIRSFLASANVNAQQLREPEVVYNAGAGLPSFVLKQLSTKQKKALVTLVESFGIEQIGHRVNIKQYNKELDEAEAEIDRGEFYTQEEVKAMTRKLIHGE